MCVVPLALAVIMAKGDMFHLLLQISSKKGHIFCCFLLYFFK